jgi:uncharacterized membrane protein
MLLWLVVIAANTSMPTTWSGRRRGDGGARNERGEASKEVLGARNARGEIDDATVCRMRAPLRER